MPSSTRPAPARREWGASLWPEEILGCPVDEAVFDPECWPMGTPAWRGPGGTVADPERMRAEAVAVLGCFESGLCPCCGRSMTESSPGWVRCSTAYATGPRSTGDDPIEHQVRTVDGRPRWRVRLCADPDRFAFDEIAVRAVPPGIRSLIPPEVP